MNKTKYICLLDLIEWPALAMFRNGMMLTYNDNVQTATEKQLNDWLTAENTLKIIGVIDEVYQIKGFERIYVLIQSI